MKKLVWLLCTAMLLGLLAGCQAEEANPTRTTAAAQEEDIRPLPPENPGSSLCEYDPDRQIYFDGEGIYMDYYVGLTGAPYFTLPVYSKAYIDPADISVSCPTDLPVKAEVTQVDILRKTEFMAGEDDAAESVMPYYVYQAYRGGYAQALADARRANSGLSFLADSVQDGPLCSDFEALTAEDLPEFYVYNIRVDLSEVPTPERGTTWTLEKLDIRIEGQTYEAKLGSVRLHNSEDFEGRGNSGATPESGGVYTKNCNELYGDGIVKLPRVCAIDRFEQDYGTITAVWMLDEGSKVLDTRVFIKSMQGEYRETDEYLSDLKKGESVYVDVIVKNENADRLLGSNQYQLVVETFAEYYDEEDEDSNTVYEDCVLTCKIYTFISTTNTSYYENYAIIFDGVDMEPYYDYYYENYLMWRKEYISE